MKKCFLSLPPSIPSWRAGGSCFNLNHKGGVTCSYPPIGRQSTYTWREGQLSSKLAHLSLEAGANLRPTLHKESRPVFNSNQAVILVQKLKSAQGLYTKSEGWNFFKNSICLKLLINAELHGLVLAPRVKKGYYRIWEANLQPLGPMFQHLLIS
jgi:hypothetical protein